MRVRIACTTVLLTAVLAGTSAAQSATPTPIDCEAVRCQLQSEIDACMSNATNHGRCVSCVTHAVKKANVPRKCRGKITRCAARSTCGKPAFETCTTNVAGTCDSVTGTCTDGTLASGLTSCATDADCIAGTKCSILRAFARHATPTPGADKCTLKGGTPGTGSCCASCPAP